MKIKIGRRGAILVGACLVAAGSRAAERHWKAGVDGDWGASANWVGEAVPAAGDDVFITNAGARVTLAASTPVLGSLALSRTLVFTNWTTALTATNVAILSGGVMTLPAAFTDTGMSNRVCVVCTHFTLAAGGAINADALGYGGGIQNGQGLGGGAFVNNRSSGGGYGGAGGWGGYAGWAAAGGAANGSAAAPLAPGSGGASAHTTGYFGAPGGGAVLIVATNVTLDGTITANGLNAQRNEAGAGSGGGVQLSCQVLAGNGGLIRANGGNGGTTGGGAGGGGRIAVHYEQLAGSPAIRLQANRGTGFSAAHQGSFAGAWSAYHSQMGTIYLSKTNLFSAATVTRLSGRIVAPGFTSWSLPSLTVTNAVIGFEDGFALNVSGALNIGTGGGLALWGDPGLSAGGRIAVSSGALVLNTCTQMVCGDDLVVTNGGSLHVFSPATNSVLLEGTVVRVSGSMAVAASSWVYPYADETNGAACRFTVASLRVDENGGFNADSKGYRGGGLPASAGHGPGRGSYYNWRGSGGGYGGQGGWCKRVDSSQWGVAGGSPYCASNAPTQPGSGGGSQRPTWRSGGSGGGLIRIEVGGAADMDGILTANGEDPSDTDPGAGSGGGILILCQSFAGGANALLRANGGPGSTAGGGPGGGGRIAVIIGNSEEDREGILGGALRGVQIRDAIDGFEGDLSVAAGTSGPDYTGEAWRAPQDGTALFFVKPPSAGTIIQVR